jgi:predicted transcriptional regulator
MSDEFHEKEIVALYKIIEDKDKELAECQAREKVLLQSIKNELEYQEQNYDEVSDWLRERLEDTPSDSTALDEAIKQAIDDEKQNPWKAAIIDGLVVCHLLTKEHENDPTKALNDLICWSNDVALDPSVSSDAVELIKQAKREALLEAANKCDLLGHSAGTTTTSCAYELRRMAEELKSK